MSQDHIDKDNLYEKAKEARRIRKAGHGQQGQNGAELITGTNEMPSNLEDRSMSQVLSSTPGGVGLMNRIRAERLKIKNQLEALRIGWEGQVKIIEIQTEANVREAKAFWDAKSVEIAESIKTYVQRAISDLEGERLKNKHAALRKLYESTELEVEKVRQGSLPQRAKEECILQMYDTCADTVERIMTSVIAEKYNLD